MLSCFRGSGLTPLSVSVTPMYDNSVFLSWNLSRFSLICFSWHHSSKASWLDVASSMVLPSPQMRMSSAKALVPSSPSKLSSPSLEYFRCDTNAKRHSVPFHFSNRSVEGCEQGTGFLQWNMPESRLYISQGKHFGIANFCKQMINSWYWIFIALECSVQRSEIYAKSYSILSRRLLDNGRSTHPVSGLCYFFNNTLFFFFYYYLNNTLFLEIFDFGNNLTGRSR